MGYNQVLENLVYETLKLLKNDFDVIVKDGEMIDERWDQLDKIMETCAITYNKSLEEVADDYENMLESQLLEIIKG